jgi:hypothetical protein
LPTKNSQTAFTPRNHLSVHDAGELHQRPIAHHLDDAAMMLGNHRLNNFGTPRFEHSQGARLVTSIRRLTDYIDIRSIVAGPNRNFPALGETTNWLYQLTYKVETAAFMVAKETWLGRRPWP